MPEKRVEQTIRWACYKCGSVYSLHNEAVTCESLHARTLFEGGKMGVYHVKRRDDDFGYDGSVGFVCVAPDDHAALTMNPNPKSSTPTFALENYWVRSTAELSVTRLGDADPSYTEPQIIMSDFNAG